MVLEATPLSVASDGNLRVAAVPTGNPLSVANLNATTTKPITYSLTPGGYNRGVSEETITDERLSLRQTFARPGTSTDTLELQYVFGDTNDVAKVVLARGAQISIVDRRSILNETDWAVGQKVDVLTGTLGRQRKDAPAKNGLQTITQTFYPNAVTQEDAVLVA